MGSPPRMRGKAMPPANIKKSSRITPAYAGKRISGTMQTTIRQGSPPRMRGKGSVLACRDQVLGITPAYAGKSSGHTVRSGTNGDHPRVCGEKDLGGRALTVVKGSPPRMRGKESLTELSDVKQGITPAYAGKRLKRSRSTVPPVAIVPLFPSVCNKPVASDGSPAGRDAPLFLPAENAVPASPAYNLRSL